MLNNKKLVPFAIGAIVIGLGVVVWQVASMTKPEDTPGNAGGQVPSTRSNAPDFGPLPDENVIGKGFGASQNPNAAKGGR